MINILMDIVPTLGNQLLPGFLTLFLLGVGLLQAGRPEKAKIRPEHYSRKLRC